METNEPSSADAEREAFREKLKSLRFGRVPGGSRTVNEPKVRPMPSAPWEKGIKGERRADGSFMPYLGKGNEPIRMKEWSENRRVYEAKLDQLRQPKD